MPTLLERTMQIAFATGPRSARCWRTVCRRFGHCVPPPHEETPGCFRCPFDEDDAWDGRAAIAAKIAERLIKVAKKNCSARKIRSPFSPVPVADHLDIARPLDVAALRADSTLPANAPRPT